MCVRFLVWGKGSEAKGEHQAAPVSRHNGTMLPSVDTTLLSYTVKIIVELLEHISP